jgi:arylsulfatase A-like enzyme
MQIETNLNVESDLFLGPDVASSDATAGDRTKGDGLIRRLNGEQLSAWQLALRPQNEAFVRSNVEMDGSISWKYQRYAKNYLRCVRAIDENIGRIYDFLHPNEKGNSWTFIYTASSGNFVGENGWFGGAWMYEPTMRIPLIITGENYVGNRVCDSNVQLLDLFPTITGVNNLSNGGINLQSFHKENNSSKNRVLYFEHYQFPEKLMVAKHYGIRNGQYKLIHYHQFDEWELFDILKDPNEQNNLYVDSIDPKLVEIIKTKLITKRKKLGLGKLLEPMPEEWRRIYRGPNARKKEQIYSP